MPSSRAKRLPAAWAPPASGRAVAVAVAAQIAEIVNRGAYQGGVFVGDDCSPRLSDCVAQSHQGVGLGQGGGEQDAGGLGEIDLATSAVSGSGAVGSGFTRKPVRARSVSAPASW